MSDNDTLQSFFALLVRRGYVDVNIYEEQQDIYYISCYDTNLGYYIGFEMSFYDICVALKSF